MGGKIKPFKITHTMKSLPAIPDVCSTPKHKHCQAPCLFSSKYFPINIDKYMYLCLHFYIKPNQELIPGTLSLFHQLTYITHLCIAS